ncbi:MAG: DUF302 domain-containing protein [Chloroflexi bacterium]|nr:DUF302 domain-containing protein [Chloroflexota bacterium]
MERVPLAMHATSERPMDEAERRLREAFAAEGFGVLTDVDLAATLRSKLGAEIGPYRILGMCNPKLAHDAVSAWRGFGLLAPCNVVLFDAGAHRVVLAFDPLAISGVHEAPRVLPIAREARAAIERALARFEAGEAPPPGASSAAAARGGGAAETR